MLDILLIELPLNQVGFSWRVHNTPLFREDNSSLTLGRDGKYYFIFAMPAVLVDELPEQLVHQALAIAQKVERRILNNGRKGLVGKKSTK